MKKFFVYFLIVCLVNIFSPSLAAFAKVKQKEVKGEELVIIQNNMLYGLKEAGTGKEIFPVIYKKINKLKYKDKNIFVGQSPNIMAFYSPDGLYNDFLKHYYESFSDIKFQNYPADKGVIIFSKNGNKGLLGVQDGILYVSQPVFKYISFPDKNSVASKNLNISFAPLDQILIYDNQRNSYISFKDFISSNIISVYVKQGKGLIENADINEEVSVNDGKLYSKYQGFTFSDSEIISFVPNVKKLPKITFSQDFMPDYEHFKTPKELYEFIQKTYNIELKNYPENIMFLDDTRAEIYEDGNLYTLKYKKFTPSCTNNLLNKVTGLNFSFQNPEYIAAYNGQYGLVNFNNEIKIPFEHNNLKNFYCNIEEKAYINRENGKLVLEFIKKDENNKYFIEEKTVFNQELKGLEKIYYLLDDKGNTEVNFKNISDIESEEMNAIRNEAQESFKSVQNAQRRKENLNNLPAEILSFTLGLALLPVMLICPNFASFHAFIRYY